jgi:hypothetical protein
MSDRAESNELHMSHQSIATMLGVRREGVTEAAVKLQAAGLITYSRARIRVVDKAGLRKKSCECYPFMRQQLDGLLHDVPGFLSRKSRIAGVRGR